MTTRFVAISGNIGVGKTTLCEYLCQRYGWNPIYEPYQANPFLDEFYADMPRWAFASQVWFLGRKVRVHLDLQEGLARHASVVLQDRTLYEDAEIFAAHLARSGAMSPREWATYRDLYDAMRSTLRPPDLLIHLRCGIRAMRRRIQQRGRPSELQIPTDYLRSLNTLYEDWVERWDACPVVTWDTDRMDWLGDLAHRIALHRAVERFL